MELTLLWAALTAAAFAWVGLRLWPDRLPDHPLDRLLGAAVLGLAAGRLAAMAIQGVNPLTSPGDIIIVRGGVLTGAASAVVVVTLVWTTRRSPSAVDALAPSVLLGLSGWHAGCLWRDACLGAESTLPWAWGLDGSAVSRHPVEIYAAVGIALGAWLVSRLGWRPWTRAGAALAIVAGVRLVTEPLRPSLTGGPTGWYLAGLIIGALALAFGGRLSRDQVTTPT
jgi:prolipoprotein diacylglyceryltransferase